MIILLLSACLAFINSARGSGLPNMKFPELIAMGLTCFIITHNWWLSIIFPIPQAIVFATGTGQYQPFITRFMQWRIFEFLSVFIYSFTFFILWYFIHG